MSDDRDFRTQRRDPRYITFREYVQGVTRAQPAKSDELQVLIELFGMEKIEKVLAGEITVEPKDFYKKI